MGLGLEYSVTVTKSTGALVRQGAFSRVEPGHGLGYGLTITTVLYDVKCPIR